MISDSFEISTSIQTLLLQTILWKQIKTSNCDSPRILIIKSEYKRKFQKCQILIISWTYKRGRRGRYILTQWFSDLIYIIDLNAAECFQTKIYFGLYKISSRQCGLNLHAQYYSFFFINSIVEFIKIYFYISNRNTGLYLLRSYSQIRTN